MSTSVQPNKRTKFFDSRVEFLKAKRETPGAKYAGPTHGLSLYQVNEHFGGLQAFNAVKAAMKMPDPRFVILEDLTEKEELLRAAGEKIKEDATKNGFNIL